MSPSSAAVRLLALALLIGAPASAFAHSLWTPRSGSLITDLKAARAGDLVTIVVDEQATGSKTADTKLTRDSSFTGEFTPPSFKYPSWLNDILNNLRTSGAGKSSYEGTGETNRIDKATARITAKVIRVLENGNLVIEGRRIVVVHDETLILVVSGTVRSQDVSADNLVLSTTLADGEIRIEGKGGISQRQQPGLFQRFFDWLGLF